MKQTVSVYVIRAGDLFKIGHAIDPEKRLRDMQTGNGQPLKLVCVGHHGQASAVEKALHRRYYRLRTRGEWFSLSADDVRWIRGFLGFVHRTRVPKPFHLRASFNAETFNT